MKHTRVQELRFPPWAQDPAGLELSIDELEVDGDRVEVDPREAVIEIGGVWRSARLIARVLPRADLCARVLPEREREQPPMSILVNLRCEATRVRRCVGVAPWAAVVELEVALEREELARTVELHAHVIRSSDACSPAPGFATLAGARLASGRGRVIEVDEPRPVSGRYLELQYKSFAADPRIPPAQRGALYRLELEREDPILYLNSDHAALRPILDGKGTRGRRVRLRELLYERIEAGAWSQLLVHTAERLVVDGELTYAWQEAVLDRWLPRLYPSLSADDERREQLIADFARLDRLLAEIDAVLQVHNELAGEALRFVGELG